MKAQSNWVAKISLIEFCTVLSDHIAKLIIPDAHQEVIHLHVLNSKASGIKAQTKNHKLKEDSAQEKGYLCLSPLFTTGFFFHFTNSFQWLSNWKMEMLLLPSILAAASWQQSNFLSSRINGIEQYIRVKKSLWLLAFLSVISLQNPLLQTWAVCCQS